jgi:hypothetical protein
MLLNAINLILSKDKSINDNQFIRENIIKLKFIGTFQANEKINVKSLSVEQNNIFTPLKRMIYGESRSTTYEFLNSTIEKSFSIIYSFVKTDKLSEKIFCKNILNDLVQSISGLKNIQRTYSDDKLFLSNVSYLIETIQAKILEIKENYPDIFNIQTIDEDFLLSGTQTTKNENKSIKLQEEILPTLQVENLNENNNLNKQLNNKKVNK